MQHPFPEANNSKAICVMLVKHYLLLSFYVRSHINLLLRFQVMLRTKKNTRGDKIEK